MTTPQSGGPEQGHRPAVWERVSVIAAAALVVLSIISYVFFTDSVSLSLALLVGCLSAAVLGATIPGFFNVGLSGRGLAIRISSALALPVLVIAVFGLGLDQAVQMAPPGSPSLPAPSSPVIPPSLPPYGRSDSSEVTASRLFAGPDQYPPANFAAYGIVAFRARASSSDYSRHLMICEAYVATIPHSFELELPKSRQMVTVWSVASDGLANLLNIIPGEFFCDNAVKYYGLVTSLEAIKDAEGAGVNLSGIGPFLLACSPSDTKGRRDALVLVLDFSDVTTYEQAHLFLISWSREIEQNPELWERGWNLEKLRVRIRLWVDKYGPKILALLGAGK